MQKAFNIFDFHLKTEPFFDDGGPHAALYGSDETAASAYAAQFQTRNETLARMIPALTPATGKVEIQDQNNHLIDQFNMQTLSFQNGWPQERLSNPDINLKTAWYHSDMNDVAFIYVYKLYKKFVEIGNLKE